MGREAAAPSRHGIVGLSPHSSLTPPITTSSTAPVVVRALAWDPTSTSSLAVFRVPPPPPPSRMPTPPAATGESPMEVTPVDGGGGGRKETTSYIDLDVFLSHDGTGCSIHETECLLRCLDARGRRGRETKEKNNADDTRGLSMDYRAALRDCLRRIEDKDGGRRRRRARGGGGGGAEDDGEVAIVVVAGRDRPSSSALPPPDDVVISQDGSLESLRLIYSISHLAEIFLLPPPSSSSSSRFDPDGRGGGGSRRLDGPAGSMTSDAVRYLRLHHGRNGGGGVREGGCSSSSPLDVPWVRKMLDDDQPEYYAPPPSVVDDDDIDGRDGHDERVGRGGPYGSPYWDLLLRCVVRGELADAWTLLSHHSACRRAEEEEEAMAATTTMDIDAMGGKTSPEAGGFAALRAILLSAPIPGGRGGDDDDDIDIDYDDEGEDEGANVGGTIEIAALGEGWDDDVDEVPLVDGVPPGADLLWEAFPRRARRLRSIRYRRHRADVNDYGRRLASSSSSSPILPEVYQPRVAIGAFRSWQDTIRSIAFPGGMGGDSSSGGGILSVLFRRFPPLRQIVSILVGSAPPSIAESSSLEWSDALLMELLYSRPDIMPEDIAARARVAMSKRSIGRVGQDDTLEEIVVAIMNGNAGQVVETMFSMCGGSSGAALPATMTSLLCDLLVDAGCLSQSLDSSSSEINLQTELHLLAAEAIVSSFSVQGQCNVGVRTAVDFLLPYSLPKHVKKSVIAGKTLASNYDIVYEPRISAMIANVLSHRPPATDSEARDLLLLCEEAARLGSIPIADACETLAFSRASHYRADGIHSREVYWLLRGMEVLSLWLPPDRRRRLGFASRRHFDLLCERSANDLISMLSDAAVANLSNAGIMETKEKEMSKVLRVAEDVLEGILPDDAMAPVLQGHAEASLLKYSVDIALADANGDTVQVATRIVHCLEEHCLSEDDGQVVSTLADPRMYSYLLHIAFAILVKEDEVTEGLPMEFAKCAFTIHGMHILMARLTQVLGWEGIICVSNESTPCQPKQPSNARKAYFKAMRLAFCKGLMRALSTDQPVRKSSTTKKGSVSLEEELELMLSPCI